VVWLLAISAYAELSGDERLCIPFWSAAFDVDDARQTEEGRLSDQNV
jgi:hypothetical protein